MSSFIFNLATSFSLVVDKHVTAFVRPFPRFTSARILSQEPSGLNWPTTLPNGEGAGKRVGDFVYRNSN